MRVLIIEDELLAQEKLETMLQAINPTIQVLAKLGSVADSLAWLRTHPQPDLAFVDIQLSDNHSFEIFRQHPIQFPVVFTTAYDKYLLESLEFNSIDYLLKPITTDKLKRALEKIRTLEAHFIQGNLDKILQALTPAKNKDRILVRRGAEQLVLETQHIAYFFSEQKVVFAKDFQGRQFMTDVNLAELEQTLDSKLFFRINRKFIAHIKAIEKFKSDNGKIRVYLNPEVKEEVHVSKETAPEFRQWISG